MPITHNYLEFSRFISTFPEERIAFIDTLSNRF